MMSRSRLCVPALLLLTCAAAGCGGDDDPTGPDGDTGIGGLTTGQTTLVGATYSGAFDTKETANTLIENVAQAVEVATLAANSGALVLTGTLTETGPGTGEFNWAAQPTDRMIVVFNGGPTFTITIQNFEGFLDGDADDFLKAHSNFRFTVSAPGLFDLQIRSQTGAPGAAAPPAPLDAAAATAAARLRQAAATAPRRVDRMPRLTAPESGRGFRGAAFRPLSPAGTVVWLRQTTGTAIDNGVSYTVNLTSNGDQFFEFSVGFVELDTREILGGTLTNGDGQITLAEAYRSHSIFNSNDGILVQNFFRENESEAVVGADRFRFVDLFVKFELTNSKISEPDFWVAQGQLQKNGTAVGQVDWSGPRIEGTGGPHAVLRFANGDVLDL